MRPVALGRRNWIHLGDEQAGPKVAAILCVVESCRRLHIPVRDYLAAILPGLNDLPIQRVADLTPAAWARQHSRLTYSSAHPQPCVSSDAYSRFAVSQPTEPVKGPNRR